MIYPLIFALLIAGGAWCAFQMACTDLRRRIIPDVYLFPFLMMGLLVAVFFPGPVGPADAALGGAIGYALGAGVGLSFSRLSKSARNAEYPPIGIGDIKLLGAGGIWLGPTGLAIATFIACITGIVWGRRHRARYIPFAAFFVPGAIIALLAQWFLL